MEFHDTERRRTEHMSGAEESADLPALNVKEEAVRYPVSLYEPFV
jgi:hypothetical protein